MEHSGRKTHTLYGVLTKLGKCLGSETRRWDGTRFGSGECIAFLLMLILAP